MKKVQNVEKEKSDKRIRSLYEKFAEKQDAKISELLSVDSHTNYLYNSLYDHYLHHYFDVQKPWLVYWIANSLHVLSEADSLEQQQKKQLSNYILYFQDQEQGGFSGGLGYGPNLISTYAAILSLIAIGDEDSWSRINRKKMEDFILSCRSPVIKGAYMAHELGEIDMRCTYAAVLIAKLLNLNTQAIFDNVAEFVLTCQTYEGGIGPVPHVEAHGGYTFCGLAAMALLGKIDMLDVQKLTYWLVNKQMDEQGGFCGRTNKLVDSCYSFWQASCFNILSDHLLSKTNKETGLLYNVEMMQKYILVCCQGAKGGLKDKPTKNVDLYHTMYALCGLSLSTQDANKDNKLFNWDVRLEKPDPVANVNVVCLENFRSYFAELNHP